MLTYVPDNRLYIINYNLSYFMECVNYKRKFNLNESLIQEITYKNVNLKDIIVLIIFIIM